MQTSPVLSLSPSSPSFNSYSSSNIAEIAARVVEEFRQESVNELDSDIFTWDQEEEEEEEQEEQEEEEEHNNREDEDEDEDEDEFEFAVLCNKKQDSPVSADEIFFNGQIKPFYPLFDTNLLLNYDTGHGDGDSYDTSKNENENKSSPRIRSPLGKLMREERETDVSLSCSSSEADDLENLQPGTYCVWTPKASKELSPGRCKKSNSTGTSKRWNKFRDLLYRSNSDGKDTFVFLAPPSIHNNNKKASVEESNDTGNNNKKGCKAVEEHYVRNRSIKEEDKKRSFLPYRQDLVGFFHNVNGLSKNLHPF